MTKYRRRYINHRLIDIFIQGWSVDITNSPSLNTYANFKDTFVKVKYIEALPSHKYVHLSKLRLSSR